jgi:hypothetical protein
MWTEQDTIFAMAAVALFIVALAVVYALSRKDKESLWQSGTPIEPGWYAILYTRSLDEGIFYTAVQWDGGWPSRMPTILKWAGPFESQASARAWTKSKGLLQV